MDNDAALEAITYGKGRIVVVPVPSDYDYYPAVEREVQRYPYDPARARQLIEETGLI